MWRLGLRILLVSNLLFVVQCDPQLDLPPPVTSTIATNPLINPPPPSQVTPSPITISDKKDDLVLPNSYAGEDFTEEGQHPIGEYESDRSNRFGPPYDDESDYNNNRDRWVSVECY